MEKVLDAYNRAIQRARPNTLLDYYAFMWVQYQKNGASYDLPGVGLNIHTCLMAILLYIGIYLDR